MDLLDHLDQLDHIKFLHVDQYERLFENTTKSEKQMSRTHDSDLCEIFNEKIPDSEKHNDINHGKKICKFSEKPSEVLQENQKHMKNIHDEKQFQYLEENHKPKMSDDDLAESLNLNTIDSSPNSRTEETCDKTKHLCNVCLLSVELEHEMKEHMLKHGENSRPPSILKKLQSLSSVIQT